MKDFTKGIICAVSVGLFGKIMYELGKRKDRKTAKCLEEKIVITVLKDEGES